MHNDLCRFSSLVCKTSSHAKASCVPILRQRVQITTCWKCAGGMTVLLCPSLAQPRWSGEGRKLAPSLLNTEYWEANPPKVLMNHFWISPAAIPTHLGLTRSALVLGVISGRSKSNSKHCMLCLPRVVLGLLHVYWHGSSASIQQNASDVKSRENWRCNMFQSGTGEAECGEPVGCKNEFE